MKNKKLKAIAVDDEQHCLDTLAWELARNCPEVELIDQITNEARAKQVLPETDIDLLFMDIHLQSTSGIQLVKDIQPMDYEVIFTTAFDQYAIESYEVDAFYYLLKPINSEKLRSAIDRLVKKRNDFEKFTIDRIMKAFTDNEILRQRIPFHVQKGIEFVEPDNILFVSGESNYSILHLRSGKTMLISKTLSFVEHMLINHTFLRIHKSYLLNLKYIERYVKADGGYIEVKGGYQLSVSRSKRSVITELFKDT